MKYLLVLLSFNVMAMSDVDIDKIPWQKLKHSHLAKIKPGVSAYKNELGINTCYKIIKDIKVSESCPTLAEMKEAHSIWKAKTKLFYSRKRYVKRKGLSLIGKLNQGDLTMAEMQIVILRMIEEIKKLKKK